MDEMQLIGYGVTVVITLGAFIAVIWKFTQPINDLKVVIQKLNDKIDELSAGHDRQTHRINKHGEEIDKLDRRVGKIETKMDMYYKD